MFLLICKLYICIQNVFGHIFYSSRLHLYWQFWQFEVQKLAYMLILAAGGMISYLSSVPPPHRFEPLVDFFGGLGATLHCSKIGQYRHRFEETMSNIP